MTDTMSGLSAMQALIANIQTTVNNIPTDASSVTSFSEFQNVLSQIQSLVDGSSFSSLAQESTTTDPSSSATLTSTLTGSSTTPSSDGAEPTGAEVVSIASQYLGVPYVWGGTSPSGFDCSGLVQYVYNELGVSLPRTSEEQVNVGTPVASLAEAQPGDLVFFPGSDGTATSPGHVGIYIGNGEMIDAPHTGDVVSIQPVGTPTAIRRIVPSTASLTSATSSPIDPTTSSTATSPTVPADLASDFVNAAGKYNIPVQLLTAVASAESGFNPTAVSSAGAEGIMQLMPQTAQGLGVDPFDPQQAIDGAAQLLSSYLTQFKSVPLALAAYNAGPNAVQQAGGVPPYPQTQAYVQEIMQSLGASTGGLT